MELGKENQAFIFFLNHFLQKHYLLRNPKGTLSLQPSVLAATFCMKVEIASPPGYLVWLLSLQWPQWPSVNTVNIEESLLCWLLIISANSVERKPLSVSAFLIPSVFCLSLSFHLSISVPLSVFF